MAKNQRNQNEDSTDETVEKNQRNPRTNDMDSAETSNPAVAVDQSILERVHRAMTKGLKMSNRDLAWKGAIRTNKDVVITICEYGKPRNLEVEKRKNFNCEISALQQLVLRATQEGCVDKKFDWYAKGKPVVQNPLEIVIVDSLIMNAPAGQTVQTPAVPQP